MTQDTRNDLKFYVSLFLGFTLLVIGCFIEPEGEISKSVLIGSGMILTITAGCIGIDFSKILHEWRMLKYEYREELEKKKKDE